MFDRIKGALAKSSSQNNNKYRDILKLSVGNIYTVRLIPNIQEPEKTFFHYYTYAWESFATGQYISNVSPQTWGDKDPVAETRYSLSKHGTDEEKEKASKVMRRENWLANIYVVKDPSNPENDGQVKLLRFGKQLHKIIMEAVEGDDSDEFGARIFDLSENGCNFKIKCEKQGDFPTYVSSRFASPSKISKLSKADAEEVYEKTVDLESVFPVKTYDELKGVLAEHFFCTGNSTDNVWSPEPESKSDTPNKEDSLDDVDPLDDDKVKELLDGLE
tara:strand:+ start:327 stop:1148 length:822 start_codon:yes stop_codon:yes gene_type:complete